MANPNFHVLIIGGGNCGLAIATGLKKINVPYTILERDSEDAFTHRTRDWRMLLHWGTEYLRNVLPPHLQARMKEPRVDPLYEKFEAIPYLNARSGEVVARIETEVLNRVSRRKVRSFLVEGEGLRIEFDKKLAKMNVDEEKVAVEFEDGS